MFGRRLGCSGDDWARILTAGQDRAKLSRDKQKDPTMTLARQLGKFLTETTIADLPGQAMDTRPW